MRTENAAALRGERDQPGCSDKYPPHTHTHTISAPKTNERVQFFVFFCHSYTCVYRVLMHTQEGRMKNVLINMLPTLQRSCHWLGF